MDIKIGNITIDGKDFRKLIETMFLLFLMVLMHNDLLANIPYTRSIYVVLLLILLITVPFKDSIILGFCFVLQSGGFFLSNGMMLDILVVLTMGFKSIAYCLAHKLKLKTVSFLCWILVLLVNIINIESFGLFSLLKIFSRLFLVVIIVNSDIIFEEKDRNWTTILAFLCLLILALFSLRAGLQYWGTAAYINRIVSFDRLGEAYRRAGGADSIGFALCIVFPLILERIIRKSSFLWIALCGIAFVIGVLSKSRVFLLTAGIVFLVFLMLYSSLDKRKKIVLYLSVVFLLAVLFYFSTNSLVFSGALSRFSLQNIGENSRLSIWTKMLQLWSESIKNILIGTGFDYKEGIGILAHNVWIEMLTAWGIVGTISMILLLFQSKISQLSTIRSNPNSLLIIGYFIGTLTISSITYDKFYLQISFVLIWLLEQGKQKDYIARI